MTAAIPPADYAGADDGRFFTQLDRLRHADCGSPGIFPARRIQRGVCADGAHFVLDVDSYLDTDVNSHLDTNFDADFYFHLDFDLNVDVDI
jgi:hypothetical protein